MTILIIYAVIPERAVLENRYLVHIIQRKMKDSRRRASSYYMPAYIDSRISQASDYLKIPEPVERQGLRRAEGGALLTGVSYE